MRSRSTPAALLLSATAAGCASPPGGFHSPEPAARLSAIAKADAAHDQSAVPHLIESLLSDDPVVRMAAIHTLEDFTGQTLGYHYWDDEQDRKEAAQRWAAWYSHQPATEPGPDRGAPHAGRTDTQRDALR